MWRIKLGRIADIANAIAAVSECSECDETAGKEQAGIPEVTESHGTHDAAAEKARNNEKAQP
jgi:hypothetical protein